MQCSECRVCIPCSVEGSGDSNCEEFDPLKITMFTSSMCTIVTLYVTFKVQILRCLPKIFLGRISLFFCPNNKILLRRLYTYDVFWMVGRKTLKQSILGQSTTK